MHGEPSKDMTTATGPLYITLSKLHRLVPDQGTTWLPILYDGYSRLNLFAEISLESSPSAGAILIITTFWQLKLIFNYPNFFPILVTTFFAFFALISVKADSTTIYTKMSPVHVT